MIYLCEQGTDEWHAARLGKITASNISLLLQKGTYGGPSLQRHKYKMKLAVERITGLQCRSNRSSFKSAAMKWGSENENEAVSVYEVTTLNFVKKVGFIDHPKIQWAGASPDGIVSDLSQYIGLAEFKCPESENFLSLWFSDLKMNPDYIPQMQWQMACTGGEITLDGIKLPKMDWCDHANYDSYFPDGKNMLIKKVERDDALIALYEEAAEEFKAEIDALITLYGEDIEQFI